MAKCEFCSNKVEETFLGKIRGTYLRESKKLKVVCDKCQSKLGNKIKDK